MSERWKKIQLSVAGTIKYAPVEVLLGIIFFVLWIVVENRSGYNYLSSEANTLKLFPLIISFSYVFNFLFAGKNTRWLYYLTFFLFIPFLFIDITVFVKSSGYGYALLLFALLLISRGWYRDNIKFAEGATRCVLDLLSGILIGIAIFLTVIAIYASIAYIFNVSAMQEFDFYSYAFAFTGYISIPIAFIAFDRQRSNKRFEASKIFNILINFILSPAVIIYTIILYVYFAKITFMWELPKGNIAYMVFAFILSVVIGQACQPLIKYRYYNWFYNYFSWISFPPLIMFWVGVVYRINQYGYTEDRVYLIILGLLATLCMLLFLNKKTGRYIYVTLTSVFVISLFTFIPNISAREIGVDSQKKRLNKYIKELGLIDINTGKLRKRDHDRDTTKKYEYREFYNTFSYVREKTDSAFMMSHYGFDQVWKLCDSIIPKSLHDYVRWRGEIRPYTEINISFDSEIDIKGFSKLRRTNHYMYSNRYKNDNNKYVFKDNLNNTYEIDLSLYINPYLNELNSFDDETYIEDKLKEELNYLDIDTLRIVLDRLSIIKDSVWQIRSISPSHILIK